MGGEFGFVLADRFSITYLYFETKSIFRFLIDLFPGRF